MNIKESLWTLKNTHFLIIPNNSDLQYKFEVYEKNGTFICLVDRYCQYVLGVSISGKPGEKYKIDEVEELMQSREIADLWERNIYSTEAEAVEAALNTLQRLMS